MKKTFWFRLIVGITVFMITINAILPTKVIFAMSLDEAVHDTLSGMKELKSTFVCPKTGIYVLVSKGTNSVIDSFGENKESIYYR